MMKRELRMHPYLNAANWAPGGSCVFWDKATHVIAKYEQMQKELARATLGLLVKVQSEESFSSGKSTLSLTANR